MASYRSTGREDRAKALAGVLLVHIVLGAVILSGLNVRIVQHAVEQLKTFDIREPPPPPPQPPPPQQRSERAREEEGAAGKKAEPSPIVAPKPKIVLPAKPPVPAAPVAGTGSATRLGASTAGTGTGAGGSGSGRGGGGTGDFSGFTPARLVRNLNRSDYRQLTGGRMPYGRAMVSLQLDARGVPVECRIARSSGDSSVDAGLCPLITRRLRFRPALDADGRPIPYRLQYVATWSL
jgi:periplasmic protein TonB